MRTPDLVQNTDQVYKADYGLYKNSFRKVKLRETESELA